MQIIHDVKKGNAGNPCVLVIGNFDAVHRGHQQLLKQAKEIADEYNKPLGLLTFEPHPRRLFRPDDRPFRITPPSIKQRRLKEHDIDILYSMEFNWDFASQSPEAFIENVLKNGIKPDHIVVGYDFCFGQLRKGTPQTLQDSGYNVTIIEKIEDENDEVISSSRIRQLLRAGEIDEANALLGWNWEIESEVIHGDKRGRELGYPTANMLFGETVHPAYGVYATRVMIEGEDEWRMAATNIGIRPMFESKTGLVETFIFDFDGDLYGRTVRVQPIQRLRG
ncbi:MAG: riboflavin biosynthesis protein RibF, partial [Pseudomonadota bacterium]